MRGAGAMLRHARTGGDRHRRPPLLPTATRSLSSSYQGFPNIDLWDEEAMRLVAARWGGAPPLNGWEWVAPPTVTSACVTVVGMTTDDAARESIRIAPRDRLLLDRETRTAERAARLEPPSAPPPTAPGTTSPQRRTWRVAAAARARSPRRRAP